MSEAPEPLTTQLRLLFDGYSNAERRKALLDVVGVDRLRSFVPHKEPDLSVLFWMMRKRECWGFAFDIKCWRLRCDYVWYDGPNWQLWVGPCIVWIGYAA